MNITIRSTKVGKNLFVLLNDETKEKLITCTEDLKLQRLMLFVRGLTRYIIASRKNKGSAFNPKRES